MSSGYKRTWEGAENGHNDRDSGYGSSSKRHQKDRDRNYDRDRDEPKDWRDVHLDSPRGKAPPASSSGSRHERDRRDDGRRDYSDRRRDGHRSGSDRYRERERERDRGRRDDRSRDRGYKDDRKKSRSGSGRRGTPSIPQEEREEGELSPPPASKRTRSPSPSSRTRTESPYPLSKDPPAPASEAPTKSAPEPELELEIATSPPPVEDLLAARRAKRLAIRAKYEGMASMEVTPSPVTASAVQPAPISAVNSNTTPRDISVDPAPPPATPAAAVGTPAADGLESKRESMSASPTPGDFALAKEDEDTDKMQVDQPAGGAQQISAADYDPSLDRREDEHKRVNNVPAPAVETIEEDEEEEEAEEEEELDDMFAVETTKKVKKVKKKKNVPAPALITTTLDSAADHEGYYSVILGEQLDGKYQVYSHLGKGMFANVVRARVIKGDDIGKEVAIKIVRCQESMYRAGMKEVQILNKLKQADPDDKKHIVRLERTFEHRGHLCLVFESLSMNLRDVVKRFGKDIGLNIRAVRAYAHQLFLSLSLLRKLNIMHADIKPDNILVNEQKTLIKLCDLGSASDASENDVTPYLVSRFYRAPEIILGVPYDPALDIWSIGCTLYELYTGKILFPGRSNNQMLLLMMELKGRFNSKIIKKAKFGDVYFDDMGGFVADPGVGEDGIVSKDVRKVHISKPTRDLKARLMPAGVKMKDDESKMVLAFIDLLDKCLHLDPARRITPKEALVHPFIRG